MSANNRQVGGEHYRTEGQQHWDIVEAFKLDYFQGQITKYVMRWKDKNGIQDLEKAQHFLEKYIESAKRMDASAQGLKAGVAQADFDDMHRGRDPKRRKECQDPVTKKQTYCALCGGSDPGPGYVNQD